MYAKLIFQSRNLCFFSVTPPPTSSYLTIPPPIDGGGYQEEDLPPWQDERNQIVVHHSGTMAPPPPVVTHRPQVIYENYDTKYNVYDSEPEPKTPPEGGGAGGGYRVTEAAAPGTVLVIGIIAGALIAVILIVMIVLKMRTRVEGAYKVDESRTYQFAATPQMPPNPQMMTATPSVTGDDTGFETPSIVGISTIPGTKATVTPAGNGFYEKYVVNGGNKKNNSGKPVKEWYV